MKKIIKRVIFIGSAILIFSFSANAEELKLPKKENLSINSQNTLKEKKLDFATVLTFVPDLVGLGLLLGGVLPDHRGNAVGISLISLGSVIMTYGPILTRIYTEDTLWNTIKFPIFKTLVTGATIGFSTTIILMAGDTWSAYGQNLPVTIIGSIIGAIGAVSYVGISIYELIDAPLSAMRYNKKMKKKILNNVSIVPMIYKDRISGYVYGANLAFNF